MKTMATPFVFQFDETVYIPSYRESQQILLADVIISPKRLPA
jgi:hypothetical protein